MTTICCSLNYVAPSTDFFYLDATNAVHATNGRGGGSRHGRSRRAGCIILNYRTGQVLIIQSYHQYWGLPKGHVEENESHLQCAIRETLEETGIILNEDSLFKSFNIFNGDGTYYLVDGTNLNYDESKICNKQEITGICWMCPTCIRRNVRFQEMVINSHLRLLLPSIIKELSEGGQKVKVSSLSIEQAKKIDSFPRMKTAADI